MVQGVAFKQNGKNQGVNAQCFTHQLNNSEVGCTQSPRGSEPGSEQNPCCLHPAVHSPWLASFPSLPHFSLLSACWITIQINNMYSNLMLRCAFGQSMLWPLHMLWDVKTTQQLHQDTILSLLHPLKAYTMGSPCLWPHTNFYGHNSQQTTHHSFSH